MSHDVLLNREDGTSSWRRRGLVWVPGGDLAHARSHAAVPTVHPREDRLRIFVGTRDNENRTVTSFVDVERSDPGKVIAVGDKPVLGLGELGCFDDAGAMPSWLLEREGRRWLYYIGWNQGTSVPYRNAIGLAVESSDGGFERIGQGPILDRERNAPQFCSTPCVLYNEGWFRMWYLSCQGWEVHDAVPEPLYDIRHARSSDGVEWRRDEDLCLPLAPGEGGLARPCVVYESNVYRMWYCVRGVAGYRQDSRYSYRIAYAESGDGLSWERRQPFGLGPSGSDWDSTSTAFPFVLPRAGGWLMFYNGDGFGRSGFGWAVLDGELPPASSGG